MSNNEFDPGIFARIGYIIHKQDIEETEKKFLELEKTKDRLHDSIDNISKNKLGVELLCKLLDIIENDTETEID